MNDSTTIFLVNDDVRCIRCAYAQPTMRIIIHVRLAEIKARAENR